jgi:hypothetical protein
MTATSRFRPFLFVVVALVAIMTNIACERRDGQSTLANPLAPGTVEPTNATPTASVGAVAEGTAVSAASLTLPTLTFPKPMLTRIEPTSAAPGATISLYGTNLNPPGAFVTPLVRFGPYSSQRAQAVSNTQLRVTVPSGNGSVSLHLETVGGSSSNFTFVYKAPTITNLSPTSGGKGQTVTIAGQGFGVKQPFDGGSFIKFGDSLTEASQWTDQMIVVKAPSDFGTGLNTDLLFALIGCAAEAAGPTGAAKLILQLSVPGCKDLFTNIVKKYQLSTNPGFLQKHVQVVVRTNAGTSNARTFTYKVATETR